MNEVELQLVRIAAELDTVKLLGVILSLISASLIFALVTLARVLADLTKQLNQQQINSNTVILSFASGLDNLHKNEIQQTQILSRLATIASDSRREIQEVRNVVDRHFQTFHLREDGSENEPTEQKPSPIPLETL